jgi:uncharacterized repeat protein (TIGR02543 family)
MKKGLFAILAVLMVFAMAAMGCDNGSSPSKDDGADTFTVTFDSNGGSVVAPITGVKKDAKIKEPTKPARTSAGGAAYTFDGWFRDGGNGTKWDFAADKVTGNITLTAKWTAPAGVTEYTVTFKWNEGGADQTQKVEAGQKASRPEARTSATHDFDDWYKEAAFTTKFDFNTPINADTIIHAKWTLKSGPTTGFKVTFDKNGGDTDAAPKSKDVTPPETKIDDLPAAPTRASFKFLGWNKSRDGKGDAFTKDTEVTSNFTVYAQWEFVGGTPTVVDGALVHNIPLLEATDVANGSTLNADGSITITRANGGALFSYPFPDEVYDNDGKLKYDFYKIEYTLENPSGAWEATQVHIQTYDGTPFANGSRFASAAQYLPLSNQSSLIYETSYSTGGFSIRDYTSRADSAITVKITAVTFYVAPKNTVAFDLNYTGAANIEPVTGIWGPSEGHPGYGLGTSLPAAPDRSSDTPPAFFIGWYDNTENPPLEYLNNTVITKTVTLTAGWTNQEPPKVEMITVNSNSGVPIYRFTLGQGWADSTKGVAKLTYTIWVNAGATANRMHVITPFNTSNVLQIGNNGSCVQSNGWGDYRLINVGGTSNLTNLLKLGKNKDGAEGTTGEWVTYEWVIGPTSDKVTTTDNPGVEGVQTMKYSEIPAAGPYYIGLGLSSNANTIVYYIKDVKLKLADGTEVAPDGLDEMFNDTVKLGALYFAAGGTHPTVVRTMAYTPGE